MTLRDTAAAWLASGRAACVVEVVEHRGSVPRSSGTRMLVSPGEVAGTIGGGHLEWQAIATARQALAAGVPRQDQRLALGPSLGQCCGGVLTLRYRWLDTSALQGWPVSEPRFVLQLYGAGHVGQAIVRLLAELDCSVSWIDEREDAFPDTPLPAHVRPVCVEPVEAEVSLAPPGAAYLVLTHSHELDLRITEAIVRRGDFGYFGLIGSKTKRARFEHRLLERGVAPQTVQRITCPIGLPGILGKEPEVMAVAVVAQLLAGFPPVAPTSASG